MIKQEIKEMLISDMSGRIHKHATKHRMYSELELDGLVDDIRKRGQKIPILLFRGSIVDGRNRIKALLEISKNNIVSYIALPHNSTEEYIRREVASMEQRRHQSKTELALSNAIDYVEHGNQTQKQVALTAGVSEKLIENAVWLVKNHKAIADNLLQGNKYNIQSWKAKPTESLPTIIKDLKLLAQVVIDDIEDDYIGAEASILMAQVNALMEATVASLRDTDGTIGYTSFDKAYQNRFGKLEPMDSKEAEVINNSIHKNLIERLAKAEGKSIVEIQASLLPTTNNKGEIL